MRVQKDTGAGASSKEEASKEEDDENKLQYSEADKARFKQYFLKPKRKPGRPRKRKRRGRPKKKNNDKPSAQLMMAGEDNQLTPKQAEHLDARLESAVRASRAAAAAKPAAKRINWDKEPHFSLRQRVADSWLRKDDLWTKGETMRQFCERMHMSRPVLSRYLKKRKKELKNDTCEKASKRGRKAHLSESVMRHVCEGAIY